MVKLRERSWGLPTVRVRVKVRVVIGVGIGIGMRVGIRAKVMTVRVLWIAVTTSVKYQL